MTAMKRELENALDANVTNRGDTSFERLLVKDAVVMEDDATLTLQIPEHLWVNLKTDANYHQDTTLDEIKGWLYTQNFQGKNIDDVAQGILERLRSKGSLRYRGINPSPDLRSIFDRHIAGLAVKMGDEGAEYAHRAVTAVVQRKFARIVNDLFQLTVSKIINNNIYG